MEGSMEDLRSLTLPDLFVRFSSASRDQADAELELLRRLDGPSGLQVVLSEEVRPYLTSGLTHTSEPVRAFVYSQLARCASSEQGINLLRRGDIYPQLIKALADESLGVVSAATRTLVTLAKQSQGEELVFGSSSIEALDRLLRESKDVVQLRVLDLFAELSLVAPATFTQGGQFLREIVQRMQLDDVLQCLNILEMLEKIAKSPEGISFLQESGALESLHKVLKTSDAASALIASGVLRLFVPISRKGDDHVWSIFTSFGILDTIRKHLNDEEPSCVEASISLVGAIGSSPSGLRLLLANEKILREWFEYFTSTQNLYKLSFLHAFAELLSCPDAEKTKSAFDIEDRGWEGKSSGEVLRSIMKYVDQPFQDVRTGAFAVLQSIARHSSWGVQVLVNYPGFFEFILNRDTETTKVGREWKYAVLEAMMKGKDGEDLQQVRTTLGNTKLGLVERYLREGPFYQSAEHLASVSSKSG